MQDGGALHGLITAGGTPYGNPPPLIRVVTAFKIYKILHNYIIEPKPMSVECLDSIQ